MDSRTKSAAPVLLVDEQELFRQGLRIALEEAGLTIVGEYSSASAVLGQEGKKGELEPGTVVLCSLTLPGWEELVRRLLLRAPDCAILGVVDQVMEAVAIQSLGSGVLACMERTLPPEEWVESIREVHAGTFSPVKNIIRYPEVARHALMLLSQLPDPIGLQPLAPVLIDRERLALGNISEGVPMDVIVEQMGVPEQTLREVVESAFRKLVARNRLFETLERVR
ncbi:MAG: hypothetical protein V3U26_02550 [Dehalococcoidia bacterium]